MKNIVVICLLMSVFCFSQEEQKKIALIHLEIFQSNRIGGHLKVEISYYESTDEPLLTIREGSDTNGKRVQSNIDGEISKKNYNRIVKEIHKISLSAILSDFGEDDIVLDGVSTYMSFGKGWASSDSINLRFLSPNDETEERGLLHYYEACKLIIKAAGLNPDDYF